jgi:hypothetical protein
MVFPFRRKHRLSNFDILEHYSEFLIKSLPSYAAQFSKTHIAGNLITVAATPAYSSTHHYYASMAI